MAVAKVIEIIAGSKIGFEDAIKQGIERANDTVSGIQSAWVKEQQVVVERGRAVEYRVTLKLTFMLESKKGKKR
jgi:hypothetical protein